MRRRKKKKEVIIIEDDERIIKDAPNSQNHYNYSGYGSVEFSDYPDDLNDEGPKNTNSFHQKNTLPEENIKDHDFFHQTTGKLFKRKNLKQDNYEPSIEEAASGSKARNSHIKHAKHLRSEDLDKLDFPDSDEPIYEPDFSNLSAKQKLLYDLLTSDQTMEVVDELKDKLIVYINKIFSDDDQDDCADNDNNDRSHNKQAADNLQVSNMKENQKDSDVKKIEQKLIAEAEYKELLAALKISPHTLTAILQEITRHDSLNFEYIKSNVDGSLLFFKDENKHVFSVPFDAICEYTDILYENE